MQRYDESLEENPFFKRLLKLFPTLYEDAPHHRWLICVPRVGTVDVVKCSDDDFQCHVLQPLNAVDDRNAFCTLNAKQVKVTGKQILEVEDESLRDETQNSERGPAIKVDILFEEVFYNSNGEKFQVVCTEGPLQGECCESLIKSLLSVSDCVAFLKQEIGDARILNDVETLIKKVESTWVFYNDFNLLKRDMSSFYNQALAVVHQNANVMKKCKSDQGYKDNICLALESYSIYVCREKVMRNVVNLRASRDAHLNRLIKRFGDVDAHHLDIDQQLIGSSGKCKLELGKLICYSTPLTKKLCLKRAFDKIQLKSQRSVVSTDELLPFFIFLVLKTPIYNWHAQLTLMKDVGFSLSNGNDIFEHDFYLATLEAALEHIESGGLERLRAVKEEEEEGVVAEPGCEPSSLDWEHAKTLFKLAKGGGVGELEEWVGSVSTPTSPSSALCHPLCTCHACAQRHKNTMSLTDLVRNFRDATHQRTALQVALGRDDVVHFLLSHAHCDVNARDANGHSSLHSAAQRGLQKTLMLLLEVEEAELRQTDDEGNSPLHLAAGHGHKSCVQTLLYCDEHLGHKMDVNAVNAHGDTPLHLAANLGFLDVVRLLLEFGAEVKVRNKSKMGAAEVAHSDYVRRLLASVSSLKGHAVRPKCSAACGAPSAATSPDRSTGPSERKLRRLHRAIREADVRAVCSCLGVTSSSLLLAHQQEDADVTDPPPEVKEAEKAEACHPLCQCATCQRLFAPQVVTSSVVRLLNAEEEGVTSLHVGVACGEAWLVAALLRWGANANAPSAGSGETPLHLAVRTNQPEMARVLLRGGASLEVEDSTGSTPVDCCLSLPSTSGASSIMAVLLQRGGGGANESTHAS